MSIKSAIEVLENVIGRNPQESMQDFDLIERTSEIENEFEEDAEYAKELVLRTMTEEEFVKFSLIVQKMYVSVAMAAGEGVSLLFPDSKKELQPYTQTVVLTIIGALHREGIL